MKEELISSAQNPRIKLIRALVGRSRERREAGAFVVEGVRLIEEALTSGWPFRFVIHNGEVSARGLELLERIQDGGVELCRVSASLMDSVSETEASQGILAVVAVEQPQPAHALDFVLIADAVRDPGNLGTLLRTAEAAGVDAVLLATGTTDAFAPKVVRAGMGAHFRLPIYEVSWDEVRTQVAAYHWNVYAADMHGRSCWETEFHHPLALIIGGEAQGVSAAARQVASETVSIPMQGKAESLNAAVAGAVLLFEVARQGRAPKAPSPDGRPVV